MSDVTSTIRIDDGFTQPLSDLTRAAMDASKKVDYLKESLESLSEVNTEEFTHYFDAALLLTQRRVDKLINSISKSVSTKIKTINTEIKSISRSIQFETLHVTSYIENFVEKKSREISDKIFYSYLRMSNSYYEVTEKIGNKIFNSYLNVYGKIYDFIDHGFATHSRDFIERSKRLFTIIGYGAENVFKNSFMFIYGFIRNNTLESAAIKIVGNIIGYSTLAYNNTNRIFTLIGNTIERAYNRGFIAVYEFFNRDLANLYQSGYTSINSFFNRVSGAVNGTFTNIKDKIISIKDIFKTTITGSGIFTNFTNAKDSITRLINGEKARYLAYKNEILALQQRALKNTPRLNWADRIGRRGNAISGWLNAAANQRIVAEYANNPNASNLQRNFFERMLASAGQRINTMSNNLIANHGARMPEIEDPNVFNYAKRRIGELANIIKNGISGGISRGISWMNHSEFGKILKDTLTDFGEMVGVSILQTMAVKFIDMFKERVVDLIYAARTAIQNSLNELEMSRNFSLINGEGAYNRAKLIANKYGENSADVSNLSLSAINSGIGTESFEKIMSLSNRVAMLKPGASTNGIAQDLLSVITSSGDSGYIGQILGKNKIDAAKISLLLKFKGFDKARKKQDLSKALDIAEEVAKLAGYTDEKYKQSSNNIAEKYKYIENVISNIKRNIGEIYTKQLSPAVDKVKDILDSKNGKRIIDFLMFGAKILGTMVSDTIIAIIDNLHIVAGIIGFSIIAKIYLAARAIQGNLALLSFVRRGLSWILRLLGFRGIAGALANISWLTVKTFLATQGLALLKVAGPFVAAGYAVYKLLEWIYESNVEVDELGNKAKTFGEWMNEAIVASYASAVACFTNVFTFFEHMFGYIKAIPKLVAAALHDALNSKDEFVKGLLGEDLYSFYKGASKGAHVVGMLTPGNFLKQGWNAANVFNDWFNDDVNESGSHLDKVLEEIHSQQTQYVKVEEQIQKALEGGFSNVLDYASSLLGIGKLNLDSIKDSFKTLFGISDDTNNISSHYDREDELRWLKAFSDRQIMSGYNYMTSNNSNVVNLNNPSPVLQAEIGRRSLKSIPNRRSKSKA